LTQIWPAESESTPSCAMDAVLVRRSPRAWQWRLEVPWGGPARLTVPQRMSRAEVENLLTEKRCWIEEQRRRQVPRLGLERFWVSEMEARMGARELVSALAEEEAERLGVVYQRIRIGGQRTLWARALRVAGSLSTGGSSWRHSRCSTTCLCTSSAICAFRTTRGASGRSSGATARTGEKRGWLREYGPELLAFGPAH
jgi:hypothetical protein